MHGEFEFDPESEEEHVCFVQDPLPAKSHDEEELRGHIVTYNWTESGQKLLDPLLHNMLHMKLPENLREVADQSEWSHYSILDGMSGPFHQKRIV